MSKVPGDSGFADELNAAISEIAEASRRVLRFEIRTDINFTGSRAIEHELGVTPDFVVAWGAGGNSSGRLTYTEAEKRTWDSRTVRFTISLNIPHVVLIISLK